MSFQVPSDFEPIDKIGTDVGDEQTEIFLFRVPKGTDMQRLNGVKFSRSRVKQIKDESTSEDVSTIFEITPFDRQGLYEQPLLGSDGQVTVGPPLSGMLSVTKSYKTKASSNPDLSSMLPLNGLVPMPEGLRVRYQPFGAGDPVRTPNGVKKHKPGKKHRHESKDEDPGSSKKRRKSDIDNNMECCDGDQKQLLDSSSNHVGKSPHKSKKSKSKSKCHEDSDDFSPTHVKKERLDLDDMMFQNRKGSDRLHDPTLGSMETPFSNCVKKSPKSAKKHKKNHSSPTLQEDNSSSTSNSFVSEGSAKKKKHKKVKMEMDSS